MKIRCASTEKYRHNDCLQNAADEPFWCGPFEFCLDCLQTGEVLEQKNVFDRTKAVLDKMTENDKCSKVQNMKAVALKSLLDECAEDYSISIEVNF